MEYDSDEDWREDNQSLERGLFPLHQSLDRAVLTEALIHLRMQPVQSRKSWYRKLEAVLHRFARSQGFRRQPIKFGAEGVHICWLPHRTSVITGPPRSDIDFMRDPGLYAFGKFLELSKEISPQWGLAQLVMVSLVVRRDRRLGDFESIQKARAVFDAFHPDFLRIAYASLRKQADNRMTLQKATGVRSAKKTERRERIRQEIFKTPQRHAKTLAFRSLSAKGFFAGKSEAAAMKEIVRAEGSKQR